MELQPLHALFRCPTDPKLSRFAGILLLDRVSTNNVGYFLIVEVLEIQD